MLSTVNIPLALLFSLICFCIYRHFLHPLVVFVRIGLKVGFNKVGLYYNPLRTLVNDPDTLKYGHSFGRFLDAVQKNPEIKVIVCGIITGISIIVCDSQIIRKVFHEYNKYVEKKSIAIFAEEMSKGLFFQRGAEWK